MGREERDTVVLEPLLIGIEHAIEPWEELLGAVVGVEDNWDAVCWSNSADVVGSSNGTSDGSLLVTVLDTLTGEVSRTALGDLEDDWGLGVTGGLERSDNSRGGGDVDSWNSKVLLLSVLEEGVDVVAVDDAGLLEDFWGRHCEVQLIVMCGNCLEWIVRSLSIERSRCCDKRKTTEQ